MRLELGTPRFLGGSIPVGWFCHLRQLVSLRRPMYGHARHGCSRNGGWHACMLMHERGRVLVRGGLRWRRVAALPVELSAEQRQAARSEEREQRYLAAARLGAPPHVDGRRRVEAVLRPLLRLRLDGEPRRERGEAARVPLSPSSGSARAGNRFGRCGEVYAGHDAGPAVDVEMAGNRWGEERRRSPRAVGRGAGG